MKTIIVFDSKRPSRDPRDTPPAGDRSRTRRATIDDSEYAASTEYLHLLSLPMWEPLRPRLACALAGVAPASGPVLELGAGTGIGTDVVLDAVPNAVLAEATAEYEWWALSAGGHADELATAGFSVSVDGDLVVGHRLDARR